jgi:hypothetical protein
MSRRTPNAERQFASGAAVFSRVEAMTDGRSRASHFGLRQGEKLRCAARRATDSGSC